MLHLLSHLPIFWDELYSVRRICDCRVELRCLTSALRTPVTSRGSCRPGNTNFRICYIHSTYFLLVLHLTPSMAGSKRSADANTTQTDKRKRLKISGNAEEQTISAPSILRPEEVDFPRGGGTSFTPVEYKTIRTEALKELKEENIFKVSVTPTSRI